jgi:hypothetical protein
MTTSEPRQQAALGFLTVIEHEQHGLLGGYLVLNSAGRPLEFHCTSSVRPNRAQAILFGPTLDAYLYGEQIGQALVTKSALKPAVICTNQPQALALRDFVDSPVLLVESEAPAAGGAMLRVDGAHRGASPRFLARRGGDRISLADANDAERATAFLATLAESFDLSEPFARIHGALEEAQRGAK